MSINNVRDLRLMNISNEVLEQDSTLPDSPIKAGDIVKISSEERSLTVTSVGKYKGIKVAVLAEHYGPVKLGNLIPARFPILKLPNSIKWDFVLQLFSSSLLGLLSLSIVIGSIYVVIESFKSKYIEATLSAGVIALVFIGLFITIIWRIVVRIELVHLQKKIEKQAEELYSEFLDVQ